MIVNDLMLFLECVDAFGFLNVLEVLSLFNEMVACYDVQRLGRSSTVYADCSSASWLSTRGRQHVLWQGELAIIVIVVIV